MLVGLSGVRGELGFVLFVFRLLTDRIIICVEFIGFTRCTELDVVRRIVLLRGHVALGHVGTLSLACVLHGLVTSWGTWSWSGCKEPWAPGERDLREPLGKTGILKGGKDVDNKAGKESRKERGKLALGLLKPWICHLENSKAYLGRVTCPVSSLVRDAHWSRLSVPCTVFRSPLSVQVGPQRARAVLWSRACG